MVLTMDKMEYRSLNQAQNRNCISCVNYATQEVALSRGNVTAIIQCCDDPKCIWRARETCESTVGAA
jgi:hypothetical protein